MHAVSIAQATMQAVYLFLDWLTPLALILTTITAAEVSELNGKSLRVAAEHWPPFVIVYPEQPGFDQLHQYFGVMEKVLEILRSSLNFTTTIVRPVDHAWGHYDKETQTWSGMIGMVHREEVDFGLGNIIYL